ncbi:long-chain-fatty-acid--CoA ligase [Brevundimonas sp. SORGH_AS_0993]|uniref:long-chain-fatty-acid--CoA ligase n=1 Tax=Brevundimonas sp. SORGH_AS_0993 TaxID=3041794 RepID=UPI002783D4FB|nr:long-chain-fatty-acid--CoA ligase [Brevundimonas sp. SORGH_AS_0993]MDQ1153967.1 acyl-CoA synthetase (AMP-forming)/AMP-acid ligase II [Brevundimonas sp. SORGH_AS_0993]
MLGLMQDWPLTVDKIIDHAKNWHGEREVVTRSVEGPIVRTTYAAIHERARRVSNALKDWGIRPGDRVATLAWNTANHIEAWYGIMGIGAVCHTLNPRLFPEQLVYIINHAEDRIIFVDLTFVPLLDAILPHIPKVERVVVMTDAAHMPQTKLPKAVAYEDAITGQSTDVIWGDFDEQTACGLCYTSGTTGNPKGVLYSHRSNFLHTFMALQATVMGATPKEVILPVVPMFHANAWGIAFAGPAAGTKLVMPGAKMDGQSIYELIEQEGVTFSAAVPTVWQGLFAHMKQNGLGFSTLKRVLIGGSACPESLIRGFQEDFGVEVTHAWGMTETSPIGTIANLPPEILKLPYDEQMKYRLKQGVPPLGVELKLKDEAGAELPHDGETFGRLMVKGPTISRAYFKEDGSILDDESFFDTGDVATVDDLGFMQITDRAKDVIKSGGEWISSIEIENIAVGHPKVEMAAVIGAAHPKWDERPVLILKLKSDETLDKQEHLDFLKGKIAKWWMPDDVVSVAEIPLGATGKIDKKLLRERMKDYRLPEPA